MDIVSGVILSGAEGMSAIPTRKNGVLEEIYIRDDNMKIWLSAAQAHSMVDLLTRALGNNAAAFNDAMRTLEREEEPCDQQLFNG